MAEVYLYSDPVTSIPRYVGKGINPQRKLQHLKSTHNKRLSALITRCQDQGIDIQPSVICSGLSKLASSAIEVFWINTFGTKIGKDGDLFNVMRDGRFPDTTRKGIKTGMPAWNSGKKTGLGGAKGVPLTQEAIDKRTATRLTKGDGKYGRPMSDKGKTKITASWGKRRELYGPSGRPAKSKEVV